jgi:cytochrome P450
MSYKTTRLTTSTIDRDPRVFPEPDKFRPSRWYGVSEHDVTMFGNGPRACIGRKFAQSEVLCFLCVLLRDWKIDVVLSDGETREAYESRVMGNAALTGTAFRVEPPPLTLTRRQ